jgi:hypothetical protein
MDVGQFQTDTACDHPLFAAGVNEQKIFLPVVEEAEIALGVALGPDNRLRSFLGAHGSSSTAGQLFVGADAMQVPDRDLSEARLPRPVKVKVTLSARGAQAKGAGVSTRATPLRLPERKLDDRCEGLRVITRVSRASLCVTTPFPSEANHPQIAS